LALALKALKQYLPQPTGHSGVALINLFDLKMSRSYKIKKLMVEKGKFVQKAKNYFLN
jgi:hypothetical protein